MSTADLIELLGASADDGLIGRGEAAQLLVEQTEGGLTKVGALLLLTHWRRARRQYERIYEAAETGFSDLRGSVREDNP